VFQRCLRFNWIPLHKSGLSRFAVLMQPNVDGLSAIISTVQDAAKWARLSGEVGDVRTPLGSFLDHLGLDATGPVALMGRIPEKEFTEALKTWEDMCPFRLYSFDLVPAHTAGVAARFVVQQGSDIMSSLRALPTFHGKRADTLSSFFSVRGWRTEDRSVFVAATGERIFQSHHPAGECESSRDVSGLCGGFKVPPETRSMHGRHYVKTPDDRVLLNVSKRSRLKTAANKFLSHWSSTFFDIATGDGKHDKILGCELTPLSRGDLRNSYTMRFRLAQTTGEGDDGPVIALVWESQICKEFYIDMDAGGPNSGATGPDFRDLQIDIVAGVDCSLILAALFGVLQVCHRLDEDSCGRFCEATMKTNIENTHAKRQAKARRPGDRRSVFF